MTAAGPRIFSVDLLHHAGRSDPYGKALHGAVQVTYQPYTHPLVCDVFTASKNNIKKEEEIKKKKEKGGQDFVNLVVLFLSRGRRAGNLFVSCDVYKGPDNPPRRNEKE